MSNDQKNLISFTLTLFLSPRICPQAARFESEASEAKSAAAELQERLNEGLRQAETLEADAEAARLSATEAQVGGHLLFPAIRLQC